MSCKHFVCICYNPETESCDYLLLFGRSRGIPGDGCNLCLHEFDEEHRPLVRGVKARRVNLDAINKVASVYDPNESFYNMAKNSGVNKDFVAKWIRKVHPEYDNWGSISF